MRNRSGNITTKFTAQLTIPYFILREKYRRTIYNEFEFEEWFEKNFHSLNLNIRKIIKKHQRLDYIVELNNGKGIGVELEIFSSGAWHHKKKKQIKHNDIVLCLKKTFQNYGCPIIEVDLKKFGIEWIKYHGIYELSLMYGRRKYTNNTKMLLRLKYFTRIDHFDLMYHGLIKSYFLRYI